MVGYVYAVLFGRGLLKVGHTTNPSRAEAKSGYSHERAYFGEAECLLKYPSESRLEDEGVLLGDCRFLFGEPIRGREWFSLSIERSNLSNLANFFKLRLRSWHRVPRARCVCLKERKRINRRGIITRTHNKGHNIFLRSGEWIRLPENDVRTFYGF
jgi:hypothetical protein